MPIANEVIEHGASLGRLARGLNSSDVMTNHRPSSPFRPASLGPAGVESSTSLTVEYFAEPRGISLKVFKPLAALLLALASFGSVARAQSENTSDAQLERRDPSVFPYSAIGLLTFGSEDSRTATAFLVGSCHVLTANHAIRPEPPEAPPKEFRFRVGRSGEEPHSVGTSATLVASGGWSPLSWSGLMKDWAILKLERCRGANGNFLTIASNDSVPAALTIASYPRDKNWLAGIWIDPVCTRKVGGESGALLTDCAMGSGSSGAPIYSLENGEIKVHGLLAGDFEPSGEQSPHDRRGTTKYAVPASVLKSAIEANVPATERLRPAR